jgi:pimeloyl-ACP methyl ester carboxylesterase
VLDLGFRSGAEPFTPYMNMAQAFALRRGWDGTTSKLGPQFTTRVDLHALAHGMNQDWRITPGYYIRDLMTSVRDGESHGKLPAGTPQSESVSARQPYGIYVPTSYDAAHASPMTVWLHWRGPGMENGAYYDPNMVWQLGEQRGDIVITPRGRGESDWYVGGSQVDVFDDMHDVGRLLHVDRDRVYVAGYSMGGWGTYVLAGLHPDLFAGGFSIVGPPALGLWPYPSDPTDPQNDRPLYWTNPLVGNFRHMPFVVFEGTDDELVPFTGPMAQTNTMLANKQPYRFYLYDGYEHFTFAISDEWSLGADYLGGARRATDPARVTYTRLPCLDPSMWSPSYGHRADGGYWVHGIALRQGPSRKTCVNPGASLDDVNKTGSIDVTSEAIGRRIDVGHPVAGGGPAPGETGSYQMTGYDVEVGDPLPLANRLDVTLTNIGVVRIDGARAQLSDTRAVYVRVTSDGATTLRLSRLAGLTGGRVRINGKPAGRFGGVVHIAAGTSTIVIRPGNPE